MNSLLTSTIWNEDSSGRVILWVHVSIWNINGAALHPPGSKQCVNETMGLILQNASPAFP